jgi:anti-sigma regulatory factor (Ser/Thr protein kinase)
VSADRFRHQALFYSDQDEFLGGTLPYIQAALAADEPVMVAVSDDKRDLLAAHLDARDAPDVRFADMALVGPNPGRVISAWHDFVEREAAGGHSLWAIGEPIWADRSGAELAECHRHESLLNLAFARGPEWHLLCPYDAGSLDDDVLIEAARNHPTVTERGVETASAEYVVPENGGALGGTLPEPAGEVEVLEFTRAELPNVRARVAVRAELVAMPRWRIGDLVCAVNELAANSVRHGGGAGTLRIWQEGPALFCEIRDAGHITDPLVGRRRPNADVLHGRGVWLVHELCDLVQVRALPDGNVVRVRMDPLL